VAVGGSRRRREKQKRKKREVMLGFTCESNECGWLHKSQILEGGGDETFRKVYRISGRG
jgi:hypothetical protein